MKYLNDGRKVVVIGTLNSQETIVQEIFVTKDGNEIPSGENFVVKSLHDEPVLSWKEKNLKDVEKQVAELKRKKAEANKEYKAEYQKLKGYKELVRSTKKLTDLLPDNELEIFSQFVTGTIEYLVLESYDIEPPVKLIDQILDYECSYGERHFDSLKLLSVCGRSEGEIEYRIHRYSDHSGGFSRVYPFVNKEDAIAHIKKTAEEKIDDGYLSEESYNNCINMGITFSKERFEKYKLKANESYLKSIETYKAKIIEAKRRFKEYQSKIIN